MTVKELIEQLSLYPQDIDVMYCHKLKDGTEIPDNIEYDYIDEYDKFILFVLPQE